MSFVTAILTLMTKNTDAVHELFTNRLIQKFNKDDVIVNAFEEPAGIYLVEKGFVKSYSVTDKGDVNIQLIRSVGDVFPLLWAIGKNKRDVFFAAMDDVIVRRISVNEFNNKLDSDESLQKEMIERLAAMYLLMAERVRNLEQRRAKDRVIYCLESLAGRFGKKVGNKVIILAPIHHHDIADMINTSRETTSREFASLEKQGLVGYHGNNIFLRKS